LRQLTGGLLDVSSSNSSGFDLGPIQGSIDGILAKFGLNFSSFIDDFLDEFDAFFDNLANQTDAGLISLKPASLASFSNLLQIGSKLPSPNLSVELRKKLYDKLKDTFPSYLYNGVAVPGLPLGVRFEDAFSFSDFRVRDFLPALAVAYGIAPSFSDPRAQRFSLDDLFTPNFGPGLSRKLLDRLKGFSSANISDLFGRFSATDSLTGLPMDPDTKEIFKVGSFLAELQVAFNLAPSLNFAAKGFDASSIQEALFPNPVPTLRSFASFIKREIMSKIRAVMDFSVPVDVIAGGLTVETPTFSANGVDFGNFSVDSTQLFPPSINLDVVQVSLVL
jgi:hypothetical protein